MALSVRSREVSPVRLLLMRVERRTLRGRGRRGGMVSGEEDLEGEREEGRYGEWRVGP
jgi:hypothetical protein